MTSDDRLARIESNLERLEINLDVLRERVDSLSVQVEKGFHGLDLRIQRLTEFQVVLMESQNQTWRALKTLSDNVEKLVRGLQGGDGGHRQEDS